jgi:hypothetical protein
LTPTLTGFQELRDEYLRLQLRGDRREALRFLDGLVTGGHTISDLRSHVILEPEERQRLATETEVILSRQSLSREIAINRIRDALRKAGVGITPQAQES